MAKYVSTGKINLPKTVLSFLFGIPSAVLLGLLYGWSMNLIPFIIVEILVIVIVLALLGAVSLGMVQIGAIRNNVVKVFCVLVVCMVAWYSQWVYYTQYEFWPGLLKFSRVFQEMMEWSDQHEISFSRTFSEGVGISGGALKFLELLELALFLTPTVFVFMMQKEYYCESCGKFNENKDYFVRDLNEQKLDSAETSGDFRFLNDLEAFKSVPASIGAIGTNNAYKVEFSYCSKCSQNGVIDIYRGAFVSDKKTKKISFGDQKAVVKRTLMSDSTTLSLLEKSPWL